VFIKRRTRTKDGKTHVYYSIAESLRVSAGRVVQRQILHLGELNTTQIDSWQHTLDVLHEDGPRRQLRLFTDRDGPVPAEPDVVQVRLSTLAVKSPRRWGDCWAGCQLWEELGLRSFWTEARADQAGDLPWAKVLELLAVTRLLEPRSELFVHEKWFPQTAMDLLLDTDALVADKDRLYRCLDRLPAHKAALEKHLAGRWRDLLGATFDVLLYDLTSTYWEGALEGSDFARRGYSRDHRPDCKQLVIALIVPPEGMPLSCEIFPGNRLDRTTLAAILQAVESKYGKARRVAERHPQAWRWVQIQWDGQRLAWDWDRAKFQRAVQAEGAYLLRAHWTEKDPTKLWTTYTQLAEAEAAFRTLKSEIKVRPIWHRRDERIEAHVLVAFLGYCLWVCLKQKARKVSPSLTPWQILDQLRRLLLVEVWFELKDGRQMCLPRITQPEPAQALLLERLGWPLPPQPPPRIYEKDVPRFAAERG
jgi:hypothetical protein